MAQGTFLRSLGNPVAYLSPNIWAVRAHLPPEWSQNKCPCDLGLTLGSFTTHLLGVYCVYQVLGTQR